MRLGQHFLLHSPTLQRIADAVDPQPGDAIIEIGPGHGELTERLLDKEPKAKIATIEKDEKLAEALSGKFKANKKIEIIVGDALELFPATVSRWARTGHCKVVGNIPYYITGHLFRLLGELEKKPERAVFLIQKEVAERIVAAPPRMNLLAASIQIWAEPRILFRVSRGHFKPQPQVDSAVLELAPRPPDFSHSELLKYYRFLRVLFRQPRKTILNNLRLVPRLDGESPHNREHWIKVINGVGMDPGDRPQNLSRSDLRNLFEAWE